MCLNFAQKLEKPKNKNRYLLIAKNLSYQTTKDISHFQFLTKMYIGGLIVEQEIKREHPLGKIKKNIGYEKLGNNGSYFRVGLRVHSQNIKRESGIRLNKIANGQWKPISDSNEKEPTEGFDFIQH